MNTEEQPRPITEADRLEARGYPITLVDGRVVRLRFGAKAMRYLERQYGSLGAFTDEAQKGAQGKAASATFDALIAGLMHLHLGTPDEVEDLLDEDRLNTEYANAFSEAWSEALPPEDQRPVAPVNAETTTTGESPGETSSSSSPSSSEEPTNNSGE